MYPTTVYPINPSFNYGCEQGWTQSTKTNYCYKYFSAVNDLKTFDEAKLSCKQDYGSDLVEILSENENQFVVSLLQNKNAKDSLELSCPVGWQLVNNNCFKYISPST